MDGPLPPRPGGGGIGRPDFEIGPGGGGIGFPDAETGGALGAPVSEVAFVSIDFDLPAFTSFVEGLAASALDDGFLELTTLASPIVGLLSVFPVLLGGGFLELTDFVVFSVLLSFALSESFSVSDFGFAFSADFLVAIPSDIAFFAPCLLVPQQDWSYDFWHQFLKIRIERLFPYSLHLVLWLVRKHVLLLAIWLLLFISSRRSFLL